MKLIDIIGIKISVSNEENAFVEKLQEVGSTTFAELSDRHKELSYQLFLRNVVNIADDGKITFNGRPSLVDIT